MNPVALRPLVVTGCARSGTTYMAALLGGLGLRLGHEDIFGPGTRSFAGWGDANGDSSWLAAPFLDEVGDALVVHQLRHPLKVVRSLVNYRFFADRSRRFLATDAAWARTKWMVRERLTAAGHVPASDHGPRPHAVYRDFLATYAPQVWEPSSEAERAMRYWHDWTRMIMDRAAPGNYERHHLETLTAESVAEILGRIGLSVAPGHVALAMTKVPSDTNTYGTPVALTWADLPDGTTKDQVASLAAELGYDPTDPSVAPQGPR